MKELSKTTKTVSDSSTKIVKLIVGLIILGFIATLAVPKVMPAAPANNKTIAKEAAAMIAGAFKTAQQAHRITNQTGANDLIPYMNYVRVDTTNEIFTSPTYHTPSFTNWLNTFFRKKEDLLQPCSRRLPCLNLYNGGILQYDAHQTFGGTTSTNAIVFNLDPDGPGIEGRISFYQYADGHLKTGETQSPNTVIAPSALTVQIKDPHYLQNWN